MIKPLTVSVDEESAELLRQLADGLQARLESEPSLTSRIGSAVAEAVASSTSAPPAWLGALSARLDGIARDVAAMRGEIADLRQTMAGIQDVSRRRNGPRRGTP